MPPKVPCSVGSARGLSPRITSPGQLVGMSASLFYPPKASAATSGRSCLQQTGTALGLGRTVLATLLVQPVAGLRTAAEAFGLAAPAGCATVDSVSDAQGAPAGVPCSFPFIYEGSVYRKCIADDGDNPPWCATADWHNDAVFTTAPYLWG